MATFHLSIVTANGTVFDGAAEAIILPGSDGQFGVLANHAPVIGALKQGLAKVTLDGGAEKYIMVGEGYADVANNEVAVIVGEAAEVQDKETGEQLLASEHPWETLDTVKIF